MKQFCVNGHDTFICGRYKDHKCKTCVNKRSRNYAQLHPDRVRATHRAWGRRHPGQRRAHVSVYNRRIRGAINVPAEPVTPYPCDLCGKSITKLNCDHDHETGKFRGWLCHRCNIALGMLGDNAVGLRRALQYLHRS